ncbi:MAG: hypothetical protein HC846_04495 [Blastocatellia bacterium]|nr:hypothetical protein [Blastocatellia bacterium]
MKTKILSIVFLSLFLMLSASTNCFAQDEAFNKKEMSVASKQKNPSEYRAQAFKKYLKAINSTKMSESELNQFVAGKLKELIVTDFYAAYFVQSYAPPEFIKWREILELIPTEQVAAFKKLTQYCAANKCPKDFPAELPKPGSGWLKKDAGSIQAKPPTAKQPKTATEYFQLGQQQIEQAKDEESIKSFNECLRINPKHPAVITIGLWLM